MKRQPLAPIADKITRKIISMDEPHSFMEVWDLAQDFGVEDEPPSRVDRLCEMVVARLDKHAPKLSA